MNAVRTGSLHQVFWTEALMASGGCCMSACRVQLMI